MRFSVIVPVYNVAGYLRACLDSILAQELSGAEVILVDDGSTDGVSGGLCDEYAAAHPELIRTIHQPNGGLGAARNTGIFAASGDYLVFVDSDDALEPGMLSALSAEIDETGADIYRFGYNIVREGKPPEPHFDELPEKTVFRAAETPELLEVIPSACFRVWKRSLFTDNGIMFPSKVWYEDIRTTMKLFVCADSIVSLHSCWYDYTVRDDSITHNSNAERNSEIMDAFDDLIAWYKSRGLYEKYRDELCRLAVEHVLVSASVRVLRIDPKSPLLGRLRDYMYENFPDFRKNPRLYTMGRGQLAAYRLLCAGKYGLVAAMFRLKDAVS